MGSSQRKLGFKVSDRTTEHNEIVPFREFGWQVLKLWENDTFFCKFGKGWKLKYQNVSILGFLLKVFHMVGPLYFKIFFFL